MAQKRMLDKKISISEDVANLSDKAKIIFTWSISHTDDIGLLPYSLRTLKAMVVPMLDMSLEEFQGYVKEIAEAKLYTTFEHANEKFVRVTKFLQYQTLKKDRHPQTLLNLPVFKHPKDAWKHLEKLGFQMETIGNQMESEVKRSEDKRSKGKRRKAISDPTELKKSFFENPIMPRLQKQYPYRDYNLQFDLMLDWWITNRNTLPQAISSFGNWLKRSEEDQQIKQELRRLSEQEAQRKREEELKNIKPVSKETLEKFRAQKEELLKSLSI